MAPFLNLKKTVLNLNGYEGLQNGVPSPLPPRQKFISINFFQKNLEKNFLG